MLHRGSNGTGTLNILQHFLDIVDLKHFYIIYVGREISVRFALAPLAGHLEGLHFETSFE